MIWNGMLIWDTQMSFPANMVFVILPIVLHYLLMPVLSFYFFSRCCAVRIRRRGCGVCAVYVLTNMILAALQVQWVRSGMITLVPEIALLVLWGSVLLRGRWRQALAVSIFVISVSNICGGAAQWAVYLVLWQAGPLFFSVARGGDVVLEILDIFLILLVFYLIERFFPRSFQKSDGPILYMLMIPVFFISLVERVIRDSIYGSTIIGDSERGLLFPLVNHGEIFFIQISACACLFLILAAYRKIADALYAEQTIRSLRQQQQAQEIYVQEAVSRYAQTRAFRHDIKNHLTVLAGLIRKGAVKEAESYLGKLEQTCAALSCPLQTGNAAVDALLGSKLAALSQEGIPVRCEMKLPAQAGVSDMDWCIALANAIDNAAAASRSLLPEERYIHVTGRKKGNLYLLSVENRCERTMRERPKEGIGLSNIRAAVQKYQGTAEIEVGDGVFRLDLLWVLPCEGDGSVCNS